MIAEVVRQHVKEVELMGAQRLISVARNVDEETALWGYAQRMKLADRIEGLAHELTVAVAKLRRERPEPNYIPEFLKKGGPVSPRNKK